MPSNKMKNIKILKLISSEDFNQIGRFIIYSLAYGVPINFVVFVIFGLTFNWYSWLAWGMSFWFLENKLVSILRGMILK